MFILGNVLILGVLILGNVLILSGDSTVCLVRILAYSFSLKLLGLAYIIRF